MTLELGYRNPFELRQYTYPFGPLEGKRILYLSDMHYHRLSSRRVENNIQQIHRIDPDIILLGGDYIDTPFGLPHFQHLITSISHKPVFAIAGNHDTPWLRRIRTIIENSTATWLHNTTTSLQLANTATTTANTATPTNPTTPATATIYLDGRQTAQTDPPPHPQTTKTPTENLSILCLHRPIDVRHLTKKYNLIFAGHLHGGQIVLWQTPKGLYPIKWLYRWNQLDIASGPCKYLISKGLGDTLPLRYNCRRDAILVTLEPNKPTT
jgi:uncharacterized protein